MESKTSVKINHKSNQRSCIFSHNLPCNPWLDVNTIPLPRLVQIPTALRTPGLRAGHKKETSGTLFDTYFSMCLHFIFLGSSLKRKKILRLFISDYFLKWVTLWCNCNTTPTIEQHQLYSWLNGVKIKSLNGIRTNEFLHFSVSSCIFHNPSRVCILLSNISILPSPTCEPWKLSLSLPLADNPYQNSCTHKTLTTSWLTLLWSSCLSE